MSTPAVPFKAKVLYDFNGENDAEMSVRTGDIVTVIAIEDEGWWEGEINGSRGLFPSNYVEPIKGKIDPKKVGGVNAAVSKWKATAEGAEGVSNAKSPKAAPLWGKKDDPKNSASSQPLVQSVANNPPPAMPARAKVGNLGLGEEKLGINGNPYNYGQEPAIAGGTIKVDNSTKFGQWAYNQAIVTGYTDVLMGILALVWNINDQSPPNNNFSTQTGYVGGYTIAVGVLTLILENLYGKGRTKLQIPVRGFLHIAVSIYQFFSLPTLLSGAFQATTGVTNVLAAAFGEYYDEPTGEAKKSDPPPILERSDTFMDGLKQWASLIRQQNRLGVMCFSVIYFCGNLAGFIAYVIQWTSANNAALSCNLAGAACLRLSSWGPWAKGFGLMLDINCAMILVPVLRTILRVIYNRSTQDQGVFAKILRGILFFIPIDMNIAFHKTIAKIILFATLGHGIIHFINISLAYTSTMNKFGISPWYTGGVICYAMFMIYTAVPDNVKGAQFEIFWYSHHWFIVFFAVLLAHGHNGINPNYWKFVLAPGFLYASERILRYMRSRQPVVVLSVTLMGDVFSVEFSKEGLFSQPYKEGQYLFLQCPTISQIEWHPFTISSAPQEKTVTIHVRIMGVNSWTRRVQHYISAMGPAKASFFSLDRQGPNGKMSGKLLGPDGMQMFKVDAPHSAPTQHLGEYSQAMIVGAGIGATPVSSALKSIVFYQWRVSLGACFPDHAYFCWVTSHKDIDCFRWLIRTIKEAQDEVLHMRTINAGVMAGKTFQFHIYVTSVPKNSKPINLVIDDEIGFWGVPSELSNVNKARAPWDEADLYKVMKCPERKVQLSDVIVYNGRPDWESRFEDVNKRHPKGAVGVTFCGNKTIAHDLRRWSHRMNRLRQPVGYVKQKGDGLFILHKENF